MLIHKQKGGTLKEHTQLKSNAQPLSTRSLHEGCDRGATTQAQQLHTVTKASRSDLSKGPPPFAVTKKEAVRLVSSSRLVRRWLYWSRHRAPDTEPWIVIVQNGGRGKATLIDYSSLMSAYQRLKQGETPLPEPWEENPALKP